MSTRDEAARHNFEYMLAGLLCLLLVSPALRTVAPGPWVGIILWLTLGVAMTAGVWGMFSTPRARTAGVLAGGAFAACGVAGSISSVIALHLAAAAGLLAYCIWGMATGLRQVLLGPRVDVNRIAGAVCIYLLMGLAWAVAYLFLAVTAADSFRGLEGETVDVLWSQLSYFSFVTLTTLGYGDVSPLSELAQSLAYLEAVIGQLYVAILIGGLVGAHLADRDA